MEKPKNYDANFDLYSEYLASKKWDELRNKRLAFDDFQCKLCGNRHNLQVHHLVYPKHGAYGTERNSDLITLCESCHGIVERLKKDQMPKKMRYYTTPTLHAWFSFKNMEEYEESNIKEIIKKDYGYGSIQPHIYITESNVTRAFYEAIKINTFIKIRELIGSENATLDIK